MTTLSPEESWSTGTRSARWVLEHGPGPFAQLGCGTRITRRSLNRRAEAERHWLDDPRGYGARLIQGCLARALGARRDAVRCILGSAP
jgi:hypothetical protein